MLEVTGDSNIYVSGLHFGGIRLRFLNQARARSFRLAISPPLCAEVRRVLDGKFQWSPERLDDVFDRLSHFTTMVEPLEAIDGAG